MKGAVLFNDIADGPADGCAYMVKTIDGVQIRVGMWGDHHCKNGSILLFPGRTGYIEGSGRVARAFRDRGFASIVPDFRGQGMSDRLAPDRRTGHIRCFTDYQLDIAALGALAGDCNMPRPWYLVGISMGGAIGLRTLVERPVEVTAAAFLAPMWDLKLSMLQRLAAWPVSFIATRIGLGHKYVPGENGTAYVLDVPFDSNELTSDPDEYAHALNQARVLDSLQLGGPSLSWLYACLHECRELMRIKSPDTPCTAFATVNDMFVDNTAIIRRMKNWPNGELVMIGEAKHDLLSERPEIREKIFDEITSFFLNIATYRTENHCPKGS